MIRHSLVSSFTLVFLQLTLLVSVNQASVLNTLFIDFNNGLDDEGKSSGDLNFFSGDGFSVTFTDDNSAGTVPAYGTEITNTNPGNIKVGSGSDFVLGTLDPNATHSSGIVALFSHGAESVSFFDSDDDSTLKSLYAFDEFGTLIGQTSPSSRTTFLIDTTATGGTPIRSIEFDTAPGTVGGFSDGTVFTIDDFGVEFSSPIPESSSAPLSFGLFVFLCAAIHARSRRKNNTQLAT